MHIGKNSIYEQLSSDEMERLRKYLDSRFAKRRSANKIGVVFDILHSCILRCVGCGTNACYQATETPVACAPSLKEIELVFQKLRTFSDDTGKDIFVNIGGGEPFLRSDIVEIIQLASSYFGCDNVGVDTNAALEHSDSMIRSVMPYLSYVGVSINGLKEYHNWWAHCDFDAFSRALHTVNSLCGTDEYRKKIEVTSVATKQNLNELPMLMELLAQGGVMNYSVHRAMAVGRMSLHPELIPDAADYLRLFVDLLTASETNGLNFHIHHSIESIHAALLLGIDTYAYDHIGNPDGLSSIGIDPECNVVFDPWCTAGIWKKLSAGNLLTSNQSISELIHAPNSVFEKAAACTSFSSKCNGCQVKCSGGSRIVAATNSLRGRNINNTSEEEIYTAMQTVDPACPLYVCQEGTETT